MEHRDAAVPAAENRIGDRTSLFWIYPREIDNLHAAFDHREVQSFHDLRPRLGLFHDLDRERLDDRTAVGGLGRGELLQDELLARAEEFLDYRPVSAFFMGSRERTTRVKKRSGLVPGIHFGEQVVHRHLATPEVLRENRVCAVAAAARQLVVVEVHLRRLETAADVENENLGVLKLGLEGVVALDRNVELSKGLVDAVARVGSELGGLRERDRAREELVEVGVARVDDDLLDVFEIAGDLGHVVDRGLDGVGASFRFMAPSSFVHFVSSFHLFFLAK